VFFIATQSKGNDDKFRESLFFHLKRVIAIYLGLFIMRFQGKWIKASDEIIRFLRVKCSQLTDKHAIGGLVKTYLSKTRWSPYKKNRLLILCNSEQKADAPRYSGQLARFFHLIPDYSGYFTPIQGPGDFELSYMIVSEGFEITRCKLLLHLGNSIDDAGLTAIDNLNSEL
jgi:hypothetical protein